MYTDGVVDALNPHGERFGAEQMLDIAQDNLGCSARDLRDDLLTRLQQFIGDEPQFDDITLVAVERRPDRQQSQAMPELPDLKSSVSTWRPRLAGVPIVAAEVRRPLLMRNLLGADPAEGADPADHLLERRFATAERRGKFLILPLDSGAMLIINPMLAGRIRYGSPLARDRTRDALVLGLADGNELRYHDAKDMGKLYLTRDPRPGPDLCRAGSRGHGPQPDPGGIPRTASPAPWRDQGRAHQPEVRRRHRQRLRRRDLLAGGDLSFPPPAQPERRRDRQASCRHASRAGRGHRNPPAPGRGCHRQGDHGTFFWFMAKRDSLVPAVAATSAK